MDDVLLGLARLESFDRPPFQRVARMLTVREEETSGTANPAKLRLLFEYAVRGDLKFISHHDTLRMFRRAFVRAGLPVRYSEGFNPLPRMTVPLPRPVGVESEAEVLLIELDRPVDPEDAMRKLSDQAPAGLKLLSARSVGDREKFLPEAARYVLTLEPGDPPDLQQRIQSTLSQDVIEILRKPPGQRTAQTVNIRPSIEAVAIVDDALEFTLAFTDRGSAKTSELAQCLGLDPVSINSRIRRMEIRWKEMPQA